MKRRHPLAQLAAASTLWLGLAMLWPPDAGARLPPEPEIFQLGDGQLIYYSELFTFIGSDRQGRVVFSLDNRRGRDGQTYQAENFALLHDSRRGWLELKGNGAYANTEHELYNIPASADYTSVGDHKHGWVLSSESNGIKLFCGQPRLLLARHYQEGIFRMGANVADMEWQGRKLHGRFVYELLRIPGFNPLSRKYEPDWETSQALHMALDDGRDLYYHVRQSRLLRPLLSETAAYITWQDETAEPQLIEFSTREFIPANRHFTWPVRWQGKLPENGNTFSLRLSDRRVLENWTRGGTAIGIVSGGMARDTDATTVYGLAYLRMCDPQLERERRPWIRPYAWQD